MRKLLSANFSRLWKEKIFLLAFVFMSVGSACFSWMSYNTAMKNTDITAIPSITVWEMFLFILRLMKKKVFF